MNTIVEKRDFKSNYNPYIPSRNNYKNFITAYVLAKLLKTNLNLSSMDFCDTVKLSFVPFSFEFCQIKFG